MASALRHCAGALALFAALSPLPLAAQSPACGKFKSQPEINACEARLSDQADAAMNRLYKALQTGLDGKELRGLQQAQQAWIAYRERQCDFETIGEEGGSIRPMEEGICYRLKTIARSAELKQLLACRKDASACPF